MSAARSCWRATSPVTPSVPSSGARVLEDFVRKYDPITLLAFCRTCARTCSPRMDGSTPPRGTPCGDPGADGRGPAFALRTSSRAACGDPCPSGPLRRGRAVARRLRGRARSRGGRRFASHRARRAVAAAEELLGRRLDEVGRSSLLAAPLYGQLVEASLAAGRVDDARAAAAWLARIAEESGRERVEALALLARARVAAATGEPDAVELLRGALNAYAALGLRLDAARTRLELARALASRVTGRRGETLRSVLATSWTPWERRAMPMRPLPSCARSGRRVEPGRRQSALLSRREVEVLRLLGEGLSNREIAERLFISPKTAEHHVSRIYAKLGLSTRGEAAAYAVRNLGVE